LKPACDAPLGFATLPAMTRLSLIAGLGLCLTGVLSSTGCKPEESEEFGFTCVRLNRAASEEGDPFVGTAQIKVTLRYEECLQNYYTKTNVKQVMDGEEGSVVFEEWKERLCTEKVSDSLVACEVEDFNQILQASDSNPIYQMTVTYRVTDPSKINGRTLLWGPGPLEAYAGCANNTRPFATLALQSDIVGLNNKGETIWLAQSWSNSRGLMKSDTAGCIKASIASAQ
jgi:hypothetical protein